MKTLLLFFFCFFLTVLLNIPVFKMLPQGEWTIVALFATSALMALFLTILLVIVEDLREIFKKLP